MLFLKLSEPMLIDGSFPLAVRVAGLQPGDTVEVAHGPAAAPLIWQSRLGRLPWLRATATLGEFMLDPALVTDPVTFLTTMVGHRAVGATTSQMGGTGQAWSHPGATARANERWAFLGLRPDVPGRLTLTAMDEPFGIGGGVDSGAGNGVKDIDTMSAVVDLSASMSAAVTDGRLVTALSAVQAVASRSKLSAVTVTFVSGDKTSRVVLPVKASVADAIATAVAETGWRTGTGADLTAALGLFGQGNDIVWVISDSTPSGLGAVGDRRLACMITAPTGPASSTPAVHLIPGEPVTELAARLVATSAPTSAH